MKTRLLAAILGVGGFFLSGCSPSDRAVAVVAPTTATPIRSQSDLERYLSSTSNSVSPLRALSAGARDRFISSITFNAKGITGFHYTDLQSELTASQVYDVLKLFGAEKDVAIIPNVRIETSADKRMIDSFRKVEMVGPDYVDHWCSSRATCSAREGSICTSNC
jgi:hypothetical protein